MRTAGRRGVVRTRLPSEQERPRRGMNEDGLPLGDGGRMRTAVSRVSVRGQPRGGGIMRGQEQGRPQRGPNEDGRPLDGGDPTRTAGRGRDPTRPGKHGCGGGRMRTAGRRGGRAHPVALGTRTATTRVEEERPATGRRGSNEDDRQRGVCTRTAVGGDRTRPGTRTAAGGGSE